MDKIITTGKLKDKPSFQDSSSAVAPAKVMCHNCSKLKVWKGTFTMYFL